MPEIPTIVTAMDMIERELAMRAAMKLYDEKMEGCRHDMYVIDLAGVWLRCIIHVR